MYVQNQTPSSAGQGLFKLLTAFLTNTAGTSNWTVRTSGSGSGGVYSQAGNVITAYTVLETVSAWFVLRGSPYSDAGTLVYRELCFQIDAAGAMRIKYSPRAGFTGGSPSATRVPSATDERVRWGGGSDASPTYTALLPSSGYRLQAYIDESSNRFWAFTYGVGGGALSSLMYLDLISPTPIGDGGYLVDQDPAVLYMSTGSNCALLANLCSAARGPMSVLAYGSAASPTAELWARTPCAYRAVLDASEAAVTAIPAGLPTSPMYATPAYAQDVMRYSRPSVFAGVTLSGETGNVNTCGDKGEGSLLRLSGTLFSTPTLLDSVDSLTGETTTGQSIGAGHLIFPTWDGVALSL